jgi:pimeloyl-ACP methyl ester carboxylesterase
MTLLLNGRPVDYSERGTGPCLVFVPGSFSTMAAWRPISELLADRFRIVATSLMGFGGTEERRTPDGLTVDRQAEAVEAVVARAGEPVHLVGHSWGGSVALAVALRRNVRLASLTLAEGNPVDILKQSGEGDLYDSVRQMSEAYIKAYSTGEHDAAKRVIDFWEGAGSFDRMPPKVREYAILTTPANIFDWSACYAFQPSAADCATLDLPTLVLYGGRSHPAARRMAEILATWLPNSRLNEIAAAAHFLITTHPTDVASQLALHVATAASGRAT